MDVWCIFLLIDVFRGHVSRCGSFELSMPICPNQNWVCQRCSDVNWETVCFFVSVVNKSAKITFEESIPQAINNQLSWIGCWSAMLSWIELGFVDSSTLGPIAAELQLEGFFVKYKSVYGYHQLFQGHSPLPWGERYIYWSWMNTNGVPLAGPSWRGAVSILLAFIIIMSSF